MLAIVSFTLKYKKPCSLKNILESEALFYSCKIYGKKSSHIIIALGISDSVPEDLMEMYVTTYIFLCSFVLDIQK